MKSIDACGISCPEPLLMLKDALRCENEVLLFVDSKNALENCKKYAQDKGFSVNITMDNDRYKLYIAVVK
ncbi:MAG: sulfurtransferase TusA family protein [Nitrososphaerota archaeon]|jgi:TusA-related sulfurtransferase|nr:sulfurtransferase TusA family protein [Nitrososphaerota archaeon]